MSGIDDTSGGRSLFAEHALLPTGWARDVLLRWDGAGHLLAVQPGAVRDGAPLAPGPVLPGMPNLHSHAFQRAFAGMTEYRGAGQDSFWSWRDLMYRFAAQITPESLEAIATWLYVEMLEAGYTSVCEFHYVHHDRDGRPYADDATLSLALLRAAPPDSLRVAVEGLTALDARAPIHIHIAEQTQEVDDCLAWSGQRPVQWLLEHAPVDARWCLVHATHMTPGEYAGAARSGAVAGICPTTEANLGDGIFDMPQWLGHGGAWGVGSDSHACVNAAEELMVLEYSQRLSRRQRNVLAGPDPQVGTAMWLAAVQGGAQASGRLAGDGAAGLAAGQPADFIALDAQHLALAGLPVETMVSAHVFGSHRSSALHSLWAGGVRRVEAGRHALHDTAAQAFVVARGILRA
jgi:cytosine/adenosine deaminase-related metal-dependent hydrolase